MSVLVSVLLTCAGQRGTNKWYRSRTSVVAGLIAGDDGRFGDGDSSGATMVAQPRQEVVVRTVWEVNDTSWPMQTRTNYGEWTVTMKVKLRARRLWNAIDKGTDNEEDDMLALEAILAAVPAEYRKPLGAKNSAKEACEAIATMRVCSDRAKKTTAQLLK